jgi:hypothetical protein
MSRKDYKSVPFEKNHVYENVYLVFIDASGHSNVVKNNPKDMSEKSFNLLFEKIDSRLKDVADEKSCDTAIVWSWLGDGGMIAIHDGEERTSCTTTIEFMKSIVELDLPTLQTELAKKRIKGELHIRIAAHKGTIKYTDEAQQGFIHSSDINWTAHLEKATPQDFISISKDIYSILQADEQDTFVPVGQFEERDVFVFSTVSDKRQISLQWKAAHGFDDMEFVQCYLSRISQKDKANLIDSAKKKIIDFGTTLNTCSNYLFSTERPVPYRDAVCRFLERGGSFVCYMISPDSVGSKQLVELRKEDTNKKLNDAMERFTKFKDRSPEKKVGFKVFQYDDNPNLAAMIIDPGADDSVCLFSPYLNVIPENGLGSARADMPHYLVCKGKHKMYNYILNFINSYIKTAKEFI